MTPTHYARLVEAEQAVLADAPGDQLARWAKAVVRVLEDTVLAVGRSEAAGRGPMHEDLLLLQKRAEAANSAICKERDRRRGVRAEEFRRMHGR